MTRYTENLFYIIKHLKDLILPSSGGAHFQNIDKKDINPLYDQFGFNKVFIMLTEPGTVLAVSSLNG